METETLDDILDSALVGLYARRPNDQGDVEFVPLDDRYNVIRNEIKQAILEAIERSVERAYLYAVHCEPADTVFKHGVDYLADSLLRELELSQPDETTKKRDVDSDTSSETEKEIIRAMLSKRRV